jgi:hypothetical protein
MSQTKKNLLNETQIRQFMKLAKLEPLTPGFVQGLSEECGGKKGDESKSRRDYEGDDELEEVRNGSPPPGLDSARRSHGRGSGAEDRLEEEEALDDLEAEIGNAEVEADVELEEPPLDEPLDEPPGDEGRLVSVDDFLAALESALEGVMGDEVEIDAVDLDVEDAEDAEVADLDAEAELDVEDELESDELVEQITKRVAARILKAALSKK